MELEFSTDINRIDWVELARVIELAPLGVRDPSKLAKAFSNSAFRCFVYDAEKLIGAGRAISDGVWRSAIFDVVVLPDHQGQGIGTKIIKFLLGNEDVDVVMLYAAPGKEEFYKKLGFRKMKTAMAIMNDPERRRDSGFIE